MKDYSSQKYNKLTPIKFTRKIGKNTYMWLCRCDCGNEKELRIANVIRKSSQTKSCGCDNVRKYFGIKALQYMVYCEHYKDGDLTLEQFVELSQKNCFYCGKSSSSSNHRQTRTKYSDNKKRNIKNICHFYYNGLDRVDNTRPHNYDNCVPCCARCNMWKQNLTIEEFKTIITNIYNNIK